MADESGCVMWLTAKSVGVEELDRQHEALAKHIEELVYALKTGQGEKQIKPFMGFLEGYRQEHFAAEERHMLLSAYPRFKDHKREHDDFNGKFQTLKAAWQSAGGTPAVVIQVQSLVQSYWRWHVMKTDADMGAHFLSRRQA